MKRRGYHAAAFPNVLVVARVSTGTGSARDDPQEYPSHKLSQTCANCQLYQRDEGSTAGGCALFGGKEVAAKGWCSAWEQG